MIFQIFALNLQKRFKSHDANLNKSLNKTKEMTKKFINPNDLRTPKEIERDRKHTQICTEYKVLRQANPNVSVYRIFSVLGSSYDMTQMGVMRLLQRRGLYHIQRAK